MIFILFCPMHTECVAYLPFFFITTRGHCAVIGHPKKYHCLQHKLNVVPSKKSMIESQLYSREVVQQRSGGIMVGCALLLLCGCQFCSEHNIKELLNHFVS